MDSKLLESFMGISMFAAYFFGSLAILAVFILVYTLITPYKELKLIRDQGMTAPAISLGGAIIGFTLPLASAIIHTASFVDMLLWSGIAMVVQILVFLGLLLVFPNFVKDVASNKIGPAAFLAALSVAAGILNAACMT
jgi:putative membrane protein